MNLYRILVLALFDLRHSIFRVKGLMFILPFTLIWSGFMYGLYDGGAEYIINRQGILITTFFLPPDLVQKLFIDSPAVLSVCLILALTTLPMFCILAGNNQLASDTGRCSLRFLLTRCTRTELFLSRYASCCVLVAAGIVILVTAVTCFSINIDNFGIPASLLYASAIAAVLIAYALPLLAFMSIFSSLMSGGMSAMLTGAVVFFILLSCGLLLDKKYPFLPYLLPNALKASLYDTTADDLVLNIAGLCVYTLVYLCIGWFIFHRRNV